MYRLSEVPTCELCGEHTEHRTLAFHHKFGEDYVCDNCLEDEFKYCKSCMSHVEDLRFVDETNMCIDCMEDVAAERRAKFERETARKPRVAG